MNNSNILKFPIRETFGIVHGRTGKLYPDIISYHLGMEDFCSYDLFLEAIEERGILYTLHMDSVLKRALAALEEGETQKVIISYQQRTTGAIALARVYHDKRNTQTETEGEA